MTGTYDPFGCRDFNYCPGGKDIKVITNASFYNCTDDYAARRSGNICKNGKFPYWQGGYPMNIPRAGDPNYGTVGWDWENEYYAPVMILQRTFVD